jgi:hypothetical protein
MAETYTIKAKGKSATARTNAQSITVPDTAAQPAGLQYHARRGDQILCQNADGSQTYYTFDAERSTPTSFVMQKV